MTSPSHKKRPTIQRNMSLWNRADGGQHNTVGLAVILIALATSAVRADEWVSAVPGGKASSPVDRLKQRSADERLRKLNDEWAKSNPNPTPSPRAATLPDLSADAPWKTTTKDRPIPLGAESRPVKESESVEAQTIERIAPNRLPSPFYEEIPDESPDAADIAVDVPQPRLRATEPTSTAIDAFQVPQFAARRQEQDAIREDDRQIRGPAQLRRVTEILPFQDYEPDAEVGEEIIGMEELVPEEIELGDAVYAGRFFPDSVFAWEASNVWYKPLYFEDVQLERYGHTHRPLIQPFVSVGRFGVQLLGLPYQMTIDPICKMIYPLGYYRPGECAPDLYYQIPLNGNAAFVTAGVYTGLFYLIP